MGMLTPTAIIGRIIWLGLVHDRRRGLSSESVQTFQLTFEGIVGDAHSGLTRSSCVRVKQQFPLGTVVRNTRQVSIVSEEELSAIATGMELEELKPSFLGANMVLAGIPSLTFVPPSSRLIFDDGASIVIDGENRPCKGPAQLIEAANHGKGLSFARHAVGRRGLVGWVERPGKISLGDHAVLHVPPQRMYEPAHSVAS